MGANLCFGRKSLSFRDRYQKIHRWEDRPGVCSKMIQQGLGERGWWDMSQV